MKKTLKDDYLTTNEVIQIIKDGLMTYPTVFLGLQVGNRPIELVANFLVNQEGTLFVSRQVADMLADDNLIYPVDDLLSYQDHPMNNEVLSLIVHPEGVPQVYFGGIDRGTEVYLEPFNKIIEWGGKQTANAGLIIVSSSFLETVPVEEFYKLSV